MKKLLRAVATSNASSGDGNEERAPSRILKQVWGSFRSSPNRQRSATVLAPVGDGQDAGPKEGTSQYYAMRQHASASHVHLEGSGATPAVSSPLATYSGAVSATGTKNGAAEAGCAAADTSSPSRSMEDEQQHSAPHQPYESWDRYLSPTGHSLAFMTAPPVEVLDFSTELLFQANVHSHDGCHQEDEGSEENLEESEGLAEEYEEGEPGFTSDAGQLGRQDAGGHLLSSMTQSRKSAGASSNASQGVISAAHAAILANGLARQPGVNLNIDYGSEIYLTDSAPIGQGQFGSVYRGVYAEKSVAIKLLPKMFLGDASPADLETFIQEAAVLSGVDHPNVVKFYGGSLSPPYVFIVEELMERSLADVLYKNPQEPFPLRRVLSVGMDVARGLQYLHCCNPAIVHRDLKPENILLDANGTAKISDFGLARCKYQSYVKTNRREAGSLAYMAPECFDARMGKLTDRLDVFSFGVLLWVMLTREFPWQGMRTHEFLQRMVIGGGRLAVPQDDNVCPLALRRLLSSCWADMPSERPSCEDILGELERMLKYMPNDD